MRLSPLAAVVAALAVCGCADLTEVTKFADKGSTALGKTQLPELETTLLAERARIQPPQAGDAGLADDRAKAKLISSCVDALTAYFKTLGRLADNKLVDVKDSTSKIGAALQSSGVVSSAAAGPASALIKVLAEAPLDAWRRQAVARLIERANDPVIALAHSLSDYAQAVADQYATIRLVERNHYGALLTDRSEPATRAVVEEIRDNRVADADAGRAKALAAKAVFDQIAKDQQGLYDRRGSIGHAELDAILQQYQDDLDKASALLPQ